MVDKAAIIVKALDAALENAGELVTIKRKTDSGETSVNVLAMVGRIRSEAVVYNSSGKALSGNAILSPTGLGALLPLRTGDKLVRTGVERNLEVVDNKRLGSTWIRIEAYFSG